MKNSLIRTTALQWAVGAAALLVILALGLIFFPWDVLRQPINRYVSGQIGRPFEITRRLDVHLGRTTTVIADGLEIANPGWASKPYLLKAKAAEFDINLWALLVGRIQIPRIALTEPQLGLQVEADGRRTWALSRDTSSKGAVPDIGTLLVDTGTLSYIDEAREAAIAVQFSIAAESAGDLPLAFKSTGKWKGEKFTASGRTGGVLKLSKDVDGSFPLEIDVLVGSTSLKARGSITDLAELAGVDATFALQGRNLDELYKLTGVVLPSTPPYKVRGTLVRQGKRWIASQMQGTLGSSDVSGQLTFDQSARVAMLTGKLQSRLLDFEDLGPVIGMKASAPRAGSSATATPAQPARAPGVPPAQGTAELPLDKGRVHVVLKDGMLLLDPLALGVAGGSVAGSIRIDANVVPAAFKARLDVVGAQLNQLFPTIETTKSSLGKISGKFDLSGRGNSAAQMLGGASGDVSVLMGRGEISNILLEFMGLDGGEVIKFLVGGDRNVQLRCAAAAFDVKQGVMTSRALVLDTSDTVITGRGQISF
ncbi:MAG: membrane assembly protein AsmA, partial [Polaromonas sp. 28-63-22]